MDSFHYKLLIRILDEIRKTNELLEIIAKNQVMAHKQKKEKKNV